MTKKHFLLLATLGLCVLATLYAFRYPERVRENVLTIFFPNHTLPVAALVPVPAGVTDTLPPIEDRYDDFLNGNPSNPIDLKDPKAIEKTVEYDPESGLYIITEKIGEDFYRAPTYMTFQEYLEWRDQQQRNNYFDRLQGAVTTDNASRSGIEDPIAKFEIKRSLLDRLFGGTTVDIKPQGNINLTFGYQFSKTENPIATIRQQNVGNFDFDMDINMSATGKIGEKLNLNFNYNTQATFDFDNQMKLHYDTKNFSEDEIVQSIKAGNVSMPLRSQLIKGAQNLFGVQTELKFGHLRVGLVASQQRSRQQNLSFQGGAQIQEFFRQADEYDENRNFLISHWNRNEFEPALKCLPVPQTQFTITRMEVWLTNDRLATEQVRDIVALADLGEAEILHDSSFILASPPFRDVFGKPLPANQNNTLYPSIVDVLQSDSSRRQSDKVVGFLRNTVQLRQGRDFEKVRARLLSPSEYSYHDQLGFISINLNVQPDQVVGIAVEYTYNGEPHKIGEFSSEVPNGDSLNQNALFVKMLKSTTPNVKLPIWDLMMKNVYAVGAVNVDPKEFRFDITYEDPGQGLKRFLDDPAIPIALRQRPLLQIFRLDTLNLQQDPGPDGIFDFVPGLTINLRNGRVMFPVLEPFGSYLGEKLADAGANSNDIRKYIYPQLYDSTLFRAREFQQLNRFTLRGSYKATTTSEISLGTFNLPQGSVRVSAGGRQLQENVDYQVDYNIGRVKILNDAILQSGQNVSVSFEDNTLFGFQARTMIGARFDYELSKEVNIGATFMNLFERPLTQKVNFGDDPINNRMYGLDFSITKNAPWLTKIVDKIPLISTKEPSSISAQAEVAVLDPGHNKAINQGLDEDGIVYIDDFEGSTANLPLTTPAVAWVMASTPDDFPENIDSSLALGANRAGLTWFISDPSVRNRDDVSNPYTAPIDYQDLFPNRQISPLEQSLLRPLDVTIYPRERGPYNFELPGGYPGLSAGLLDNGELNLPETRWAGFMRGLQTNDFEASNIEFVEFWMLNPYMDPGNGVISQDGVMFIELGNISEDIMRDSRQFFENAIPTVQGSGASVDTRWGRVPVIPPVVNAFDNDADNRRKQDVGLDGVDDEGEKVVFADWFNQILSSSLSPNAKDAITADPANDNFRFYLDPIFNDPNVYPDGASLLERYRRFNNQQGNSPANTGGQFVEASTNQPDMEDLNRDNSLNENESFFRYRIPLPKRPGSGPNDELDLTDSTMQMLVTDVKVDSNGFTWYRFKMPLDMRGRQAINGIQDFRSIRFMRVYWREFTERTTFRFATLELGRNQWRRFTQNLHQCSDRVTLDPRTSYDINAVSIEENSSRLPFNYTIPFGIQREQSVGAFPNILQNEQAMSFTVCDLYPCDSRGVFKILNMNLTQFKRMKMFVHTEERDNDVINPEDMTIFVRIGSDFINNYYEYEIPLVPSDSANLSGVDNPDSRVYKEEVWRPENIIDFPLEWLTDLKRERNRNQAPLDQQFVRDLGDGKFLRIAGNPNLGYVKGIMIGIRNIDTATTTGPHCVEAWFNELRLTGFNERGGFAGLARVDMKLADLGNLSLAGNFTSKGWGSIEERILQRQLEDIYQFDVSTNLELGKFLPEKSGIKIPFYAQYTNVTSNPEYDPYDLDVKLKDKIEDQTSQQARDSIRKQAQTVETSRSVNFTNVRKERTGNSTKLPMPWNIENFSVSYGHTQQKKRTPLLINDQLDTYRGSLDYQYASPLKPIQPFKKLIKKDKYFKWITDFNFNPVPNTYGFSTNLERVRGVTTYRFAGEDPNLNTYYNRRFTWDRNYDLGWDLSKSLRFSFDATARSIIDEQPYEFNPISGARVTESQRRDTLLQNMRRLGRPKNYTHTFSLNYTLPFKSIPFLDWITVKASYTGGYTWNAQSLKLANLDARQFQENKNSRHLGNVIQNNSTRQINGDFNFETLYNKSKYLAKINKPAKPGSKKSTPGNINSDPGAPGDPSSRGGRNKNTRDSKNNDGLNPAAAPGTGGNTRSNAADPDKSSNPVGVADPVNSRDLDTPNPPDRSNPPSTVNPGGRGNAPSGAPADPLNRNSRRNRNASAPDPQAPQGANDPNAGGANGQAGQTRTTKASKNSSKKGRDREPSIAERILLRPLMMVRKARFNYSENYTTVIPGFTPDASLLGLSNGFDAPGWNFVAGFQPGSEWLDEAAAKGWITQRFELNQQVTRNYTQNFDAGITIEPFRDFKVDLSANRQYSRNNTELFKDQNLSLSPDSVNFQHRAQRDFGSFTTSYMPISTLFDKDIDGLFQRFSNNRPIVSARLGYIAGNTDPHAKPYENPGYSYGYGRIQQEVLIPAFIAAYSGKDANSVDLDIFKTLPAVNWKVSYNGLSKIGNLSSIFSSINITHGYRSTLTVNSYNTDIFYEPNNKAKVDELNFDYIARFEIPQILISEQLQPLLGIEVKLKNEMQFRFEIKKQRQLAMSFVDYQLAETQSSSYTGSFGYRMKNVVIPFLMSKAKKKAIKKSKKKKPSKSTEPTPPAPPTSGPQGNDLSFKFDFELRDDITVNHRLDQLDVAQPTRGTRMLNINPSIEYAISKRLSLRLFTDYNRTVPKTSQSFPSTRINSGVTIQFKLN